MRLLRLSALGALLGFAGCTQTSTGPTTSPVIPAPLATETPRALPPPSATPRNAFVVLSGGGSPLSNNYSQFLQAKAFAAFLAREFPGEPRWIFFGVGNREGAPPVLADARRQVRRDGLLIESWLPGALPDNRPATRESFLRALREEILPTVSGGGTLFLFVGDHGTQAANGGESEITLWQLKRGGARGAWTTDNKEELGVEELRGAIAQGIGHGRVVFLMTQCHSGGFHFLGAPRAIAPPAEWFTRVPDWARPKNTGNTPLLAAAGFTATDENSIAAGCDPDPDPEKWAGYERFAAEQLLGLDLFTLAQAGAARSSFADAHEAATLVDRTIDKPRATSDQFLAQWADAIERMEKETSLAAPVRAAVAAYRRAVDSGQVTVTGEILRAKQEQFARFTQRAGEQIAAGAETLHSGTRAQIEEMANGPRRGGGGGARGGRGNAQAARRAWRDTLRPAWKRAVEAGKVAGVSATELAFEKKILALEDRGRDVMFGGSGGGLLNETYWSSTYAEPAKFDPVKAEAITRWAAERRERVARWAKESPDDALRAAGETLGAGARRAVSASTSGPEPLGARTAGERVLFYRRVLAAGEFLETMQHRAALEQLQRIVALERTPFTATVAASVAASLTNQPESLTRNDAKAWATEDTER